MKTLDALNFKDVAGFSGGTDLRSLNSQLRRENAKRRNINGKGQVVNMNTEAEVLLDKLRRDKNELSQSVDRYQRGLSESEREVRSSLRTIAKLKDDLEERTSQLDYSKELCNRYKNSLAACQQEIMDMISDAAAIKRENLKLIIELSKLKAEKDVVSTVPAPSNAKLEAFLEPEKHVIEHSPAFTEEAAVVPFEDSCELEEVASEDPGYFNNIKKSIFSLVENKRREFEEKSEERRIQLKKKKRLEMWNKNEGVELAISNKSAGIKEFSADTWYR